ncbi:hypothetical protein M431DRAFT_513647 [Trichoderma harzianum CBS 226.95]|uniref:Uncharacterized protein n=1 Tax=Trichoderma harzianum CBS 226.95 TaxID=983964 RepID=A0A2T3ZUC2_TRIHA|nr:hypothetical protein M431DRAFT_513647 [Trichoderma harzianum CBS 226.95]PTB48414.1 hypothetical protein M431DRAFT_513647 [Trichoderma harzianum CBS 226.95]
MGCCQAAVPSFTLTRTEAETNIAPRELLGRPICPTPASPPFADFALPRGPKHRLCRLYTTTPFADMDRVVGFYSVFFMCHRKFVSLSGFVPSLAEWGMARTACLPSWASGCSFSNSPVAARAQSMPNPSTLRLLRASRSACKLVALQNKAARRFFPCKSTCLQ